MADTVTARDPVVNPFLRMKWRAGPDFVKHEAPFTGRAPMSPDALNSLFSLLIGFALAGALVSGYQALARRPAGFGLLQQGAAPRSLVAVPFLMFAAPFIIMRNTLLGPRSDTRPDARLERRRVEFVMMATVLSGFWSLMSGTFVVMTLRAIGLFA